MTKPTDNIKFPDKVYFDPAVASALSPGTIAILSALEHVKHDICHEGGKKMASMTVTSFKQIIDRESNIDYEIEIIATFGEDEELSYNLDVYRSLDSTVYYEVYGWEYFASP